MNSHRLSTNIWLVVVMLVVFAARSTTFAQDNTELAKQTQNPLASLISVPFQNNFNFGTGSKEKTIWVLNIQPVIPVKLTDEVNLVTRTILPVINQPSLFPGTDSATGLGDLNPTFWFSPTKPGRFIWGIGPTLTLPTATDSLLGNGKWSAGPSGVALLMEGHWVVGGLINNQWSFAGWGDQSVNQMLIQPFVNFNLPDGWYLVTSPIITANWKADKAGDVWTLPLGGGVGKLFKVGKQPINTQIQVLGNVAKAEFGSDWQLRVQIQFLFPK